MANGDQDGLTFYPAYCHKASPTYFTWVKLSAANIHALKNRKGFEGQNLYFHLNHPIQFITLVGILVAFDDQYEKRWIMTLDDSSGATIELVLAKPETWNDESNFDTVVLADRTIKRRNNYIVKDGVDMKGIDIGTVVKTKGTMDTFRGIRQIQLERLSIVRDTNAEVKCWEQQTRFLVDVLSTPWFVSPEEQKRLLREAEGVRDKERGREGRKKKKEKWLLEKEKRDAERIARR